MAQQVIQLDVNEIQANPLQPRGVIAPESIMELVDSIREHGILEPLVVAHTPAGYQIIAGERRWRASKLANLQTVPVIVKETNPQGMLEMALVENVQREDLNPLERAKAFERLLDEFSLSNIEIGKRIGKSTSYVSNTMKLLILPDALKDGILSGLISEGHARALLAIRDNDLMVEAYKTILRESGSVRRAEDLARRTKKKMGLDPAKDLPDSFKGQRRIIHDETDRMEKEMNEALDEETAVNLIRTQRRTKVNITFKGSPKATQDKLERLYKKITSYKL